jgi:hypothetical protein
MDREECQRSRVSSGRREGSHQLTGLDDGKAAGGIPGRNFVSNSPGAAKRQPS